MNNEKEHSLWVEKYRPKDLDTFIGNKHIIDKLKIYIKNGDVSNLLLFGPAGCGKTTISKIIINHIDCDYLYLNISDEGGVDIARNKIKNFASTIGFKDLKIVVGDEFDFGSPNFQAALRNLMETYSRTTRFILTANYIEKIIDPIQSRCQTFEVLPPGKNEVGAHVVEILRKENVKFNKQDLITLINSAYPDIRKIINLCQLHNVNGQLIIDKQKIIEENYMLKILEVLKKLNNKTKAFTDIRQILADSKVRQFETLYKFLYDNVNDITSDLTKRAAIILVIAEAQYQDSFVVDKEINVMAMFINLINEL